MKPRTLIVYGVSGSTKTSQMYHLVKYLHQKTGKQFRFVASDPGGMVPFEDSGMIEQGIVDVYNYSATPFALADLRRLGAGYWPITARVDGVMKEHYLKSIPECMTTPEQWEKIGGYVIDSVSGIGDALKHHASDQDTGVGFKESWKFVEDDETITGLTQGHYGIAQKEIHSRLTRGFANLPVQWLLCTALLGKGEDKQSRESVYGPQIVGNAATPHAPSWFGHCLHLSRETYQDIKTPVNKDGDDSTKEGFVAWFTQHLDSSTRVPYLCKPRIAPELYLSLVKCFPHGFVPLDYTRGLSVYLDVIERLNTKLERKDNAR